MLKGKHPSQPFNPDVANAFFRAGLIEAWGRGIARMMQACRAAGTPPPVLRHEPAGLWVEFAFAAGLGDRAGGAPVETRVETPVDTPTKTREEIVALMARHPEMSLAEIAVAIGRSASAVERASARLASEGRIKHVGAKKTGRWEVLK